MTATAKARAAAYWLLRERDWVAAVTIERTGGPGVIAALRRSGCFIESRQSPLGAEYRLLSR